MAAATTYENVDWSPCTPKACGSRLGKSDVSPKRSCGSLNGQKAMTDKPSIGQTLAVLTVFVLIAMVCRIAWAVYAYDDWTCAWAECRKMKP